MLLKFADLCVVDSAYTKAPAVSKKSRSSNYLTGLGYIRLRFEVTWSVSPHQSRLNMFIAAPDLVTLNHVNSRSEGHCLAIFRIIQY